MTKAVIMRRLACCNREREISVDFDEQDRIVTYDGLGSCINQSYEDDKAASARDGYPNDTIDDDKSSCSSSKEMNESYQEWEATDIPHRLFPKPKQTIVSDLSDIGTMKERYSKLLLGDDISGGTKGVATALSLSNAITRLAASVFGELWKLEPLMEEKKNRWQKEMEWFLSPTNYMVELVPTRQKADNGCTVEIMTPKPRADIHLTLPALRKLDSLLIDVLDSMVNTEFWYIEDGTKEEKGQTRKRWWLPLPRVPKHGLSDSERKKLFFKKKIVYQVYKASKAINETVLSDMAVPVIIKDGIPKSGRVNLGEDLYKILTSKAGVKELTRSLQLKSENRALEVVNKLESAIFVWKEKASQLESKSPSRVSWSFLKNPISEHEKVESLLTRAEILLRHLKSRYPNLPHTFLDASKIQYGKDVGHAVLEAYSRVLGSLASSILSRIGDVLQEDALSNPHCSVAAEQGGGKVVESRSCSQESCNKELDSVSTGTSSDADYLSSECISSSANSSSPSRSRGWCVATETSSSFSP